MENKKADQGREAVAGPDMELRLAILGMIDGNGHPYSWSAMFNGYDPEEMKKCPYPVIADYLSFEDRETMRIPNARLTHIWTDRPEEARFVARASNIETVVEKTTGGCHWAG